MNEPTVVKKPLVIVFENDDHSMTTHIWPSEHINRHEMYGLLICDLVRHVAGAFKVDESAVWEWVEKERWKPTTDIRRPS